MVIQFDQWENKGQRRVAREAREDQCVRREGEKGCCGAERRLGYGARGFWPNRRKTTMMCRRKKASSARSEAEAE